MKRVAILFCGRVKAWQHCFDRFKHHILQPLHNAGYEYDGFLSHSSKELTDDTRDFIQNYNIVSYQTIIPDISSITVPLDPHKYYKRSPYVMYYHWKNAFHLAEEYSITNGFHYDLVIYMRADQYFNSDLNILDRLDSTAIYIPSGNDWTGLNDQFAMGSFENMKIFTSLYDNVHLIYSTTGIPFHTETYVKLFTKHVNMNIQRFQLDYILHSARFDPILDNYIKSL
jgi:hypothetical protein